MHGEKSGGDAIRLFSTNSVRGVTAELLPQFEREHGVRVSVSYDPALVMLRRIADGEAADVALLGQAAIDALAKQGKIASASRRTLARCGVGIAVRAGAPKPDVSSVEALRKTLLEARSVCHTTSGASGLHFLEVIERLGIAAAVKEKAVCNEGGLIGELVAEGKADLAVQQIPELMAVPGIELVGPLPQELQSISVVAAGIFTDVNDEAQAQRLVDYLASPAAGRVFRAKGLEPA